MNKHLFVYALTLSWVAEHTIHKTVFITDVQRNDPESVHFHDRGFDARCFYAPRGDNILTTITELEWRVIENTLGKILEYGGNVKRSMIVVHGDKENRHAHNQIGLYRLEMKI